MDVLLRVAEIAGSGELIEMDVNPLLARPEGVVGLDALVRLAGGGDTKPEMATNGGST